MSLNKETKRNHHSLNEWRLRGIILVYSSLLSTILFFHSSLNISFMLTNVYIVHILFFAGAVE